MKKISSLLVIFLLLSGAQAFAQDSCCSEDVARMTKINNGQEMVLFTGECFSLELQSLGSAGYSWQTGEIDPGFLKVVSKQTRPISDQKLVGAPEVTSWCFQALKEGWTELKLDYYRPWEGAERATDHYILRIMIIPALPPK